MARETGGSWAETGEWLKILNKTQEAILNLLVFPAHSQLSEPYGAHNQIFSWVFDPQLESPEWSNFCQWLERPKSGIYWVRGREGSGKSTLMKKLWLSPTTQEHLAAWKGSSELLAAAFSPSKEGSVLNSSYEGLLRYLLHSLLSQAPDHICVAFPQIFSEVLNKEMDGAAGGMPDTSTPMPLTVTALEAAFKRIIHSDHDAANIFLMVDGIDEYENHKGGIAGFCSHIAASSNAKIVVFSREITELDQTLGTCPSLRLARMNKSDIEETVKKTLLYDMINKVDKDTIDALAKRVSEQSQGRFDWAKIMVPHLIAAL
ncbi:hypothetical protein GGR57DRAFT_503186 [Xylariaceae sp. FL1272]|nr:hypothetical protein GGR57DRAFT_503186 [Xylariaceae sp. FL1272]